MKTLIGFQVLDTLPFFTVVSSSVILLFSRFFNSSLESVKKFSCKIHLIIEYETFKELNQTLPNKTFYIMIQIKIHRSFIHDFDKA